MEKLKLSEAMRLGATLAPQGFYKLKNSLGATCAIGAAFEAVGFVPTRIDSYGPWIYLGNQGKAGDFRCPACRGDCGYPVAVITHLNDEHRWTREQIADFVEANYEQAASPTPVPEAQPVEVLELVHV